ncbi:type II toxin-antitoxin system VapB family antitoxin [Nocardia sp. NPDC003963]
MPTVRIELDQDLLVAAGAIMGTATSKATIHEALRRIVVHERQLRHFERLAASALDRSPQPATVEG